MGPTTEALEHSDHRNVRGEAAIRSTRRRRACRPLRICPHFEDEGDARLDTANSVSAVEILGSAEDRARSLVTEVLRGIVKWIHQPDPATRNRQVDSYGYRTQHKGCQRAKLLR